MTATLLPNKESFRLRDESPLVHPDELRTAFALAMSHMYRKEVPLYGDLVRIVQTGNRRVVTSSTPDSLDRLTLERHGAIRLGKLEELHTVRRIFALLGMHAVGYYDLSMADLPMLATCFRPIDTVSLAANPFRVFTTLLRPELIRSPAAHDLALKLLKRRNIFSQELLPLRTFSWAPVAEATQAEYDLLRAEHSIPADIVSFRTAHINHLTPRTLDIDATQNAMAAEGMPVKSRIEGPPRRKWPILLRQTSFLALEEKIQFRIRNSDSEGGEARFGEIEERGAAVTPAGRTLYDQLLKSSMQASGHQEEATDEALVSTFRAYPDTWEELRKQELVYVNYSFTGKLPLPNRYGAISPSSIESLVEDGVLETLPITYEDFLP